MDERSYHHILSCKVKIPFDIKATLQRYKLHKSVDGYVVHDNFIGSYDLVDRNNGYNKDYARVVHERKFLGLSKNPNCVRFVNVIPTPLTEENVKRLFGQIETFGSNLLTPVSLKRPTLENWLEYSPTRLFYHEIAPKKPFTDEEVKLVIDNASGLVVHDEKEDNILTFLP